MRSITSCSSPAVPPPLSLFPSSQCVDEHGRADQLFDAKTGLRRKLDESDTYAHLAGKWRLLPQSGACPQIRHEHTMTALGRTHLVVLGGEAVGEDFRDGHQGHVLDGNVDNVPVLGMSVYHIASGRWTDCSAGGAGGAGWRGPSLLGVEVTSRFAGVSAQQGVVPISNHRTFELPPTLTVRLAIDSMITGMCGS